MKLNFSIPLTITTIFLLASPMLTVKSCKDAAVVQDIPHCIRQEIIRIHADKLRNPPGSVWQYEYNHAIVYYIPSYCCDIPGRLLDSNCRLICSPDGGYTGKGDGKCPDFFEKRTNGKLIWQDTRKLD